MLKHAIRARRFFPLAPRHQAAKQAVAYAKAIEFLGDNWLALRKVEKLAEPRPV